MTDFTNPSRHSRRRLIKSALALGAATSVHGMAWAQSKVTRIVVPYAAGGGTDILARHFAEALGPELGETVIVENRPGGGGNIGGDAVAKSAPDGSTFLLGDMALAVNPSLFKRMPFNPMRDLQPIAAVGTAPLVLVVGPSVKANTVKELVALARAQPGKISFATAGNGNPPHMAGALFRTTNGLDLIEVPYKGTGPAITDVIGDQVSMLFTGLSSALPHILSGKVRALAVTGATRARAVPEVPTMAEAGFPQIAVTSWWGLFAPVGVPDAVAGKVTRAAAKVTQDSRFRGRLSIQSIEAWEGNASLLGRHLSAETSRWQQVIADAKITPV